MNVANAKPPFSNTGGGIGVNIDQVMGGVPESYTPTGRGIFYTVTSLPSTGLRLDVVGADGTVYCANLTVTSGMVPWATFNTKCYDTPEDGTALTAAPLTSEVEFQAAPNAAAVSWDFCVTALSFAP